MQAQGAAEENMEEESTQPGPGPGKLPGKDSLNSSFSDSCI